MIETASDMPPRIESASTSEMRSGRRPARIRANEMIADEQTDRGEASEQRDLDRDRLVDERGVRDLDGWDRDVARFVWWGDITTV